MILSHAEIILRNDLDKALTNKAEKNVAVFDSKK